MPRTSSSGHKMHCCPYCNISFWKLPRHLERQHAEEDEVRRVLAMAKNSKERREGWAYLTRKGDYKTWLENQKNSQECRIPLVRNTETTAFVDPRDVGLCPHCRVFLSSRTLYKHEKKCFAKPDNTETKQPLRSGQCIDVFRGQQTKIQCSIY